MYSLIVFKSYLVFKIFICFYSEKITCAVGSTLVCTAESSDIKSGMVEVCPGANSGSQSLRNIPPDKPSCNCLPVRMVEQDLADGINPLGRSHKGCALVLRGLVFPDVEGFNASKYLFVNDYFSRGHGNNEYF